jgi:hypothetical protein
MYENIKLWEDKLEYLKDLEEQYLNLDKSHYDFNHWATYNDTIKKLQKKISDYENLIEYLKK